VVYPPKLPYYVGKLESRAVTRYNVVNVRLISKNDLEYNQVIGIRDNDPQALLPLSAREVSRKRCISVYDPKHETRPAGQPRDEHV
jgi:hypothetical protein